MNLNKVKSLIKKPGDTLERIFEYLRNSRIFPITYVQKPSHKPSTLGSPCSRKIYYSYFKVPEESKIEPQNLCVMEAGNKMEEMIVEWLKAIGEHIPFRQKNGEIKVDKRTNKPDHQFIISSEKWRIRKGKIDNVARDDVGLWIYEIKSVNDRKFKLLKKGPFSEHLIQNSIYLQCFNDLYLAGEYDHIPEIKGGGKAIGLKLIYINRNDGALKHFVFKIEELTKLILDIDRKIAKENQYIDTKTLPPKTPDMCNYCNFRSKCDFDWNKVDNIQNNDKLKE